MDHDSAPTTAENALPEDDRGSSATPPGAAQTWLSQLQAIIENLASQSVPVIREVGAKAAEVAALAAERAGPLAQRAAEATAQAGGRVAERSRELAEDLRTGQRQPPDATASAEPDVVDDSPSQLSRNAAPALSDGDGRRL